MHLDGLRNKLDPICGFAFDTTFVVFFLGLEFGRTIRDLAFDGFLLLATMGIVVILPYYLPSNSDRPMFAKWLMGRALIAAVAVTIGAILGPLYGSVLPDNFKFMPLTLLILAAMTTCFIRFYVLMRLRPAK